MQIMSRIARVISARGATPAVAEAMTVGDGERRLRVVIEPGLPDAAYHQLFHLDLPESQAGILYWDHRSGSWRTR